MNQTKLLLTLLITTLGLGFASFCCAEETTASSFYPALFGKSETSLPVLIKFPASKKDFQEAVKCESKIGETGKVLATACFSGEKKFHRAILDAAQDSMLSPAKIDGEVKSVYLLYTVIFVKKGDEERVMVIPNHSINIKEFGLAYVAPQRLVYKKHEYNLECPDRPFYHLVSASISSAGKISDISLSKKDKKCVKCRKCVEKIAGISSFIPGFVKSQPTTMNYQEPYFKGERYLAGYRALTGMNKLPMYL